MWRKDEPQATSPRAQTKPTPVNVPQTLSSDQTASAATSPINSAQPGCLTRLLVVKGEITGQDDLVIDGEVHGKIRLTAGKLTIGPEGRVTADIEAPEPFVSGELKGKNNGPDPVPIAPPGKDRPPLPQKTHPTPQPPHPHAPPPT